MGVVRKHITLNGKAMIDAPVDAGGDVKGPLDRASKTLQKKSPDSAGRSYLVQATRKIGFSGWSEMTMDTKEVRIGHCFPACTGQEFISILKISLEEGASHGTRY